MPQKLIPNHRTINSKQLLIVNQKWIAKNPLILYIEHRGTEARRNKYIEKVKTIEPDFYSVNSVLSKNKALCSIPFFANQFCSTINESLHLVGTDEEGLLIRDKRPVYLL